MADTLTPLGAYQRLATLAPTRFLFESVTGGDRVSRYSFMGALPWGLYRLYSDRLELERGGSVEVLAGDPIESLRAEIGHFDVEASELPFTGGFVGHFGYDFVRLCERLPDRVGGSEERPLALLARYDNLVVFDRAQQKIVVVSNEVEGQIDRATAGRRLELLSDLLTRSEPATALALPSELTEAGTAVEVSLSGSEFEERVAVVKGHIARGDIYQAVLCRRWDHPLSLSPISLYRAVRIVNPSPYMVLLEHPEMSLVGASPEMLVKKTGRRLETRPIAGTRPRSSDPERDAALGEELLADLKERSEHVMLVDLGRNDLGRVSMPGSVTLPSFMEIERYSHVMHIVSSVIGRLNSNRDGLDALMACFPAGTVTGAPKIRAMEIIDELEPISRGPYAGAVGYFSFGGDLDTCITIRTLEVRPDRVSYAAGAGIVADSDPQREVQETESKAAAARAAIDLAAGLEATGWISEPES
ncbi:MAG: anthranilate synthase component I family protein [Acidobacteriota bacterium]